MSPTPLIVASLILTALLMMFRENPAKCPSLAKNPPKYTTAYMYSSTEQLQVAL